MDLPKKNERGSPATFEAKDLSPHSDAVFGEHTRPAGGRANFQASDPAQAQYSGMERRRAHRRNGSDRRTEMRFDLERPDRRLTAGRRSDDAKGALW